MRNLKLIHRLWGILLLLSPNVFADDLAHLREIMDPIENLSGDFQQVITENDGTVVQQSSGIFTLQRPGYFYWQSEEPFAQTIVGSPEQLMIYDPDLEQLTVRKQTLTDTASPVAILTGDTEALPEHFSVVYTGEAEQQEFVLTPKAAARANYQRVAVVFDGSRLRSIRFVDKLDQTTAVTFANLEQNSPIEPGKFDFVPPPGTDIVRDDQ